MLCDDCGKKEVKVRYEENINGIKKKINLCEECAKKTGILKLDTFKFGSQLKHFDNMFLSFLGDTISEDNIKEVDGICPKCKLSFDKYKHTGLFGCDECYKTFKDRLNPMLKKYHGNTRHLDIKQNSMRLENRNSNMEEKNVTKEKDIDYLRKQLDKCIKNEEYEKAVVLRDKIKELEKRSD